jgi:serine/threonine protein kinase
MVEHIGEGAFGQVSLAIEKQTGKQVAIKAVNIIKICEINKDRHILREQKLLDSLRFKSVHIINLLGTFKVSTHYNFFLTLIILIGREKLVLCV